jgi:hypothetical protein
VRLGEPVLEEHPVGEPHEPVVQCLVGELGAERPFLGDVPDRDDKVERRPRGVAALPTGTGAPSRGPNPGGRASRAKQRQRPTTAAPLLPRRTCRGCGEILPALEEDCAATRRWWCDGCRPERRAELDDRTRKAASVVAEQHRAETGVLPSHNDQAQSRRRETNRRRQLARLSWEADHGGESPDVDWYSEQIAPRLTGLSLTEIAGALGVSTSSASKFRRGLRVPASRHWEALAQFVGVETVVQPRRGSDGA